MKLDIVLLTVSLAVFHVESQFPYGQENPAILYDTRASALDGSYQFQYTTQDGIAHISHSTPDKVVSGEYGYTDPTGLKVNFKYNTGTHTATTSHSSPTSPSKPSFQKSKFQQKFRNEEYFDDYDYDSRIYNQPRYRPTRRNEYDQYRISYTSNY